MVTHKEQTETGAENPSDLYDELHRDVTKDTVILCDKM